ncbi:MAG TPA: hypothetical protein VIH90_08010 [Candidatus Saccharimonadales bacterium]
MSLFKSPNLPIATTPELRDAYANTARNYRSLIWFAAFDLMASTVLWESNVNNDRKFWLAALVISAADELFAARQAIVFRNAEGTFESEEVGAHIQPEQVAIMPVDHVMQASPDFAS